MGGVPSPGTMGFAALKGLRKIPDRITDGDAEIFGRIEYFCAVKGAVVRVQRKPVVLCGRDGRAVYDAALVQKVRAVVV